MIGDDPYTLGLFDTAGMLSQSLQQTNASEAKVIVIDFYRSGGLRPTATALVPPDRRLPRLFLGDLARLVRERKGEVVPGSPPPLPRCSLPDCWNPGRSERRPGRHREALETETEADHNGAGRAIGKGAWCRQVC